MSDRGAQGDPDQELGDYPGWFFVQGRWTTAIFLARRRVRRRASGFNVPGRCVPGRISVAHAVNAASCGEVIDLGTPPGERRTSASSPSAQRSSTLPSMANVHVSSFKRARRETRKPICWLHVSCFDLPRKTKTLSLTSEKDRMWAPHANGKRT